jgi:hypothetical protein
MTEAQQIFEELGEHEQVEEIHSSLAKLADTES